MTGRAYLMVPPEVAVLKSIEQVLREQEFLDKKRQQEKNWAHDLVIMNEELLRLRAIFLADMQNAATEKMMLLEKNRILEELNDKNIQRILMQHASVGGSGKSSFYANQIVYDESLTELRLLEVEIAKLQRIIDVLENQIAKKIDEVRLEETEIMNVAVQKDLDQVFIDYDMRLVPLIIAQQSLEDEKRGWIHHIHLHNSQLERLQIVHAGILRKLAKIDEKISDIKLYKYSRPRPPEELEKAELDKRIVLVKLRRLNREINSAKLQLLDTQMVLKKLESSLAKIENNIEKADKDAIEEAKLIIREKFAIREENVTKNGDLQALNKALFSFIQQIESKKIIQLSLKKEPCQLGNTNSNHVSHHNKI